MNYIINIPRACITMLFYISIIIDLINGYLQLAQGIQLPIGQFFRIILLLMLIYSIRSINKKNSYNEYVKIWIVSWLICFSFWIISSAYGFQYFSLAIEINDMLRILYLWICILFFLSYKDNFNSLLILNAISNYGFIIASCIIISFITGFGHYSYGEDYGFGTKSWFIAGNDLGTTLIMCILTSSILIIRKLSIFNLIRFGFTIVGSVLIGSRVGIIGSIIILVYWLTYYITIYRPDKINRKPYIISIICFAPIVVYSIIIFVKFIYSSLDTYALARLSFEGIGSARESLSGYASEYINKLSGISILFGQGVSSLYYYIARIGGFYTDYKSAEADIFDTIGSFGFLFGLYTLAPFFWWTIKSIKLYFQSKSYITSSIFLVCILFIGIGTLSGHCIKNTMAAPIYAFYISLLYKINENTDYIKYVSF